MHDVLRDVQSQMIFPIYECLQSRRLESDLVFGELICFESFVHVIFFS